MKLSSKSLSKVTPGTLWFFCGKMGAGKTTQSHKIADKYQAVRIAEDEWLAELFPKKITTFDDYLRYSKQLKPVIKSHVQQLLRLGVSVVMDFPANTRKQRAWLQGIALPVDAPHQLVLLDVTDAMCLQRLAKRRIEQPERAAFDTEAVFHQVSAHFERPTEDEGLVVTSKAIG